MSKQSSFIKTLAVIIIVGGFSVGCGPSIEKVTKQAEADAKASFEAEKAKITAETDKIQQELDEATTKLGEKDRKIQELDRKLAQKYNLEGEETDRGLKLTLAGGFKSGKADLLDSAMPKLENLAKYLQYSKKNLLIIGYTDNRGDEEKNQELSEQRANAVGSALIKLGVAEDRIETQGAGQSDPVASNDTAKGRKQNRRVEITILN
jgi:outer membrane protein OmpA-like peptidoglycan-associated protein